MSAQYVVIAINCLYCILLIAAYYKRSLEVVYSNFSENEQLSFSPAAAPIVIAFVVISLTRNSDIFNYDFLKTITGKVFILQFIAQFFILFLYLLPTRRVLRLTHTWLICSLLLFSIWTGLLKGRPFKDDSMIELSVKEIQGINEELRVFQDKISNKISAASKNMESAITDLKKKESDLQTLNNLLNEKETELKHVDSIISLEKEKVNDLLNYKQKNRTIYDLIQNVLYGIIIGVIGSYFANHIPLLRKK